MLANQVKTQGARAVRTHRTEGGSHSMALVSVLKAFDTAYLPVVLDVHEDFKL